jgi:epoxyqueuosine reductase QueG
MSAMNSGTDWKGAIAAEFARLVASLPENRHPEMTEPIFRPPLIGFAAAADPLFARYQEVVGPFHRLPLEWLPAGSHASDCGTVISWILPIAATTRASNSQQDRGPSRAWAITRTFGEACNNRLRERLVAWLQSQGYAAVAPVLHPEWAGCEVPGSGPASNWSERHAAYAAGLGTFSLNDGLITAAGIAHRCGSVVTSLVVPPEPRPYAGVRDWCLFHACGSCGVCIRRCPVGAIDEHGHDKRRCRDYTYGELQPRLKEKYGIPIAGCGLCQTGVPCEARNPCR